MPPGRGCPHRSLQPHSREVTNAPCPPSLGLCLPQCWALGPGALVKGLGSHPLCKGEDCGEEEELGFETRGPGRRLGLSHKATVSSKREGAGKAFSELRLASHLAIPSACLASGTAVPSLGLSSLTCKVSGGG